MIIIRTVHALGARKPWQNRICSWSTQHCKSNSCHAAAPAQRRIADPGISDRCRGRQPDEAAKGNRYGHRDATMILLAYRHGFRATRTGGPALGPGRLRPRHAAVRRVKRAHPAPTRSRRRMRALRRLQREQEPKSPFVFTSERGSPFTTAGFARMVERAGAAAGLASRPTRTCCGMPAASRWPTRGTIRGRCRPISATGISSTRCATPSCRRIGSRTSGDSSHLALINCYGLSGQYTCRPDGALCRERENRWLLRYFKHSRKIT